MKQGKQRHNVVLWLTLLITAVSVSAFAQQTQRYWITLSDRGPHVELSEVSAQALGISDHALWRRAKVLPADKLVDELDLPINQAYLDQLQASGIKIRSTSRWFNTVSAELTPTQQTTVSSLPFVASVGPVAVFIRHEPEVSTSTATQSLSKQATTADLTYGPSLTQLSNINVVAVHNLGINGAGVVIGMLDNGFNNRKTHPALKNIKVIAEYDFVYRDSNTSITPGEYSDPLEDHGEWTLSTIGGFENGKLIGVAYGASFVLAKTEIDSSGSSIDFRVEEDLFVEGLEWEERLGAEIVSSSLGYNVFLDGPSYSYQDMNGRTATTTKAARVAARKGVLLVTAMGNEGNYQSGSSTGTLIAPADADSIVSVGAVSSNGVIAYFSSTGPTSDGRTKPEVVAQGVSVYVAGGSGGYQYSNGTSFSTPLTAGVAALVLSAHPTWTPMQVRQRLIQTAKGLFDNAAGMTARPNNFFGWGMVDALNAVQGTSSGGNNGNGVIPTEFVLHNNYPNPFNGSTAIVVDAPTEQKMELAIYNLLGQKVRTIYEGKSTPGSSTFYWRDGVDDANNHVATGIYICRLNVAGGVFSQKIVYLK
ncbi:MAG: S8 family peptidase [Ignavibacteriales bacterium]|nr:S8 family peptidase [Ignavibacteriales bacterium]